MNGNLENCVEPENSELFWDWKKVFLNRNNWLKRFQIDYQHPGKQIDRSRIRNTILILRRRLFKLFQELTWKEFFNSHHTGEEKCVEIVETLHVNFFLFGSSAPCGMVTVKISFYRLKAKNTGKPVMVFLNASDVWWWLN